MKISITLHPKKLVNGRHPLRVRLTHKDVRRNLMLGLSIEKNHWDEENQRPNRRVPKHLESEMKRIRTEIERVKDIIHTNWDSDWDVIVKVIKGKNTHEVKGIWEVFEERASVTGLRSSTIRTQRTAIRGFLDFLVLQDIGAKKLDKLKSQFDKGIKLTHPYNERKVSSHESTQYIDLIDIPTTLITSELIKGYFTSLKKPGNSIETAKKHWKDIKSLLRYMIDMELIEDQTKLLKRLGFKTIPLKNDHHLTIDEIKSILDYTPTELERDVYEIYKVGIITSQRFSDIVEMRWEDLREFEIWELRQNKTAALLELRLPEDLVEMLKERYSKRLSKPFPALSNQYCNRMIKAIALNAGLVRIATKEIHTATGEVQKVVQPINEFVTMHTSRHSSTTLYRDRGFSELQIAAITGHTSIKMAKKYGRQGVVDLRVFNEAT